MTDMSNASSAPVRTIENARRDTPLRDVDLDDFLTMIRSISWFGAIGQPSPWDAKAVRLRDWSGWSRPDDPAVLALALHGQSLREALETAAGGERSVVEAAGASAHEAVMDVAPRAVAFNVDADPYDPQSQCVWDAAFAAATTAGFVSIGLEVPPDLHELWTWFHAGHWPCGFAGEPAAEPVALHVL
jgi:hypothetical protein